MTAHLLHQVKQHVSPKGAMVLYEILEYLHCLARAISDAPGEITCFYQIAFKEILTVVFIFLIK